MPLYEVRYDDKIEWEEISEIDLMQRLHETYDRVTPAIQQMIEGEQVLLQKLFTGLKVRRIFN
jgi:hypothetical protein